MAQIGCFVPAQRLRLSPVTHIFSICHTPESTAISLSQFGLELSAVFTISFDCFVEIIERYNDGPGLPHDKLVKNLTFILFVF